MRRTLFAVATVFALVWALPASAQKHTKKEQKAEKQSNKEAAQDAGSTDAPDKVLYDRAMRNIKKGKQEVGRLTLQTLINTYPDSEYLAKAKLAIADSYFKEGGSANLAQAIAGYKDFIVFFPFLPEASYAQYQVAMTHFKQMEKPDRDRTEALAAESELQTYLQKYPADALTHDAEQRLREVQEILAESEFRVGYFYYVKDDRRAAAGRLLPMTKRYPLYSKADEALWMLGDIFEKSEKKEVASIYYAKIVRDYPLSDRAGDAKAKLVAFGVPVPQPDAKALAWMQAEQNVQRQAPGMMSKPLSLIQSRPKKELVTAARNGAPNLQPDTETYSAQDILTGGGSTRIGGSGGSATGNQAIVEVATPGTGAGGGSTVENSTDSNSTAAPATDPNAATPAADPNAPAQPATDAAPAGDPKPQTDGTQPPAANGTTPATGDAKPADKNTKESTSKKKKGLRKIVPW